MVRLCCLAVALGCGPGRLAAAESPDGAPRRRWTVDLRASPRAGLWYPGFREDVLVYQTEGLQTVEGRLMVLWAGAPVFYYQNEFPLGGSSSQRELIAESKDDAAALKKVQVGVLLEWVPGLRESEHALVGLLRRLQYLHTEATFYGEAVAMIPFSYVSRESDIIREDPTHALFGGLLDLEPGDAVAFRTKFKEDEISTTWPVAWRQFTADIRFGGYTLSWWRPSDLDRSWRLVEDDRLLVYETRFFSRGMVLGVEIPGRQGKPAGWHTVVKGRWGFDNDISNGVNRDYEVEPGKELLFASGVIDVSYRGATRWTTAGHAVEWTLGGSLDRRIFATEIHPLRGTWEADNLLTGYGSLHVMF